MKAAIELAATTRVTIACRAFAVARSSFYADRHHQGQPKSTVRRGPSRGLRLAEQQHLLEVLNSDRFCDVAPRAIAATLIDEGVVLASPSTMYRLLRRHRQVRERRQQKRLTQYQAPELLATAPNHVWTWDITKLKGPVKGTCLHLYVILDIYSRQVVGWMVAERESDVLAREFINQTCRRQKIQPGQLLIHADRGSAMRSKSVAELLSDLDVAKSHSRPYCSNDNPYSESQFKTMKYRPDFPKRFGCVADARAFCRRFFQWYNSEHRHSGIAMLTPEAVHAGRAPEVIAARNVVLAEAWRRHPERYVRGCPTAPELPQAVWINPPRDPMDMTEFATLN
jgi:putative transposase